MPKYRKKPVVVEAVKVSTVVNAFKNDWDALPDWIEAAYEEGTILVPTHDGFTIKTLEGNQFASLQDMVIQGVQGEIYPCKMEIFHKTYEQV